MKKPKISKKNKSAMSSSSSQALVFVSLKNGVLDPQGQTIKRALDDLGYQGIQDVRSGKFYQIRLDLLPPAEARKVISEISSKLLANPVIETFQIQVLR